MQSGVKSKKYAILDQLPTKYQLSIAYSLPLGLGNFVSFFLDQNIIVEKIVEFSLFHCTIFSIFRGQRFLLC